MRCTSSISDSCGYQFSIFGLIVWLLCLLKSLAFALPTTDSIPVLVQSDEPVPLKLAPNAMSRDLKSPRETTANTWKSCSRNYNGPWDSVTQGNFPTVQTILTDMNRCGNIGQGAQTIFYSFGAATSQMRPFRDSLRPQGSMWNDALPESWTTDLGKKYPIIGTDPKAQDVIRDRYAEALAKASKGEVFFGLSEEVFAKGKGAYSDPRPSHGDPAIPEDNVWLRIEFPVLQRNNDVTKVTLVVSDSDPSYKKSPGWTRGDNQPILPDPSLPILPPITPLPPISMPTPAPTTPPAQPSCNPKPTGHYQDAHDDEVHAESKMFCNTYATSVVKAKDEHISQDLIPIPHPAGNDKTDDNFEFTITSVAGCPAGDGYNLGEPVKGFRCEDILFSAWSKCNNAGRGGSIMAGCLTYGITPKY